MKSVIVFDIDGTLTAERYTAKNILKVKENPPLMGMALALQEKYPLIISTARPEKYREQTEKWLAKHNLKPEALYMREEGRDYVADQMIKFGHLQDIRKNHGEPVLWADDNDANIRMLERADVPVIHVKLSYEDAPWNNRIGTN